MPRPRPASPPSRVCPAAPRPRPPPRQTTRWEPVQAPLPRTGSSRLPAQSQIPPRPSHPRPRKGNGHSEAKVRNAQRDSAAAGAVPNSQLPRVSSGLVPLPTAGETAAASPRPERRNREVELRARSSGAAPTKTRRPERRWRAWSLQPCPSPHPPDSASAGVPAGVQHQATARRFLIPSSSSAATPLLAPVRVALLPQAPVRPQLPAQGPPVAPGSGGCTHLGRGAGVWRGPAGGR